MHNVNSNDQLLKFQEFFIDTFYTLSDAATIQQQLKNCSCDPVLMDWISTLTPAMLEVAARMLKRWGIKAK